MFRWWVWWEVMVVRLLRRSCIIHIEAQCHNQEKEPSMCFSTIFIYFCLVAFIIFSSTHSKRALPTLTLNRPIYTTTRSITTVPPCWSYARTPTPVQPENTSRSIEFNEGVFSTHGRPLKKRTNDEPSTPYLLSITNRRGGGNSSDRGIVKKQTERRLHNCEWVPRRVQESNGQRSVEAKGAGPEFDRSAVLLLFYIRIANLSP